MSDPISEIKQKLQKEIDQLSHELNVLLPKEIAVARAHGDLSENAEYKSAKERQSYVNARLATSRSAWATSACSTSPTSRKTAPDTVRALLFWTSTATSRSNTSWSAARRRTPRRV